MCCLKITKVYQGCTLKLELFLALCFGNLLCKVKVIILHYKIDWTGMASIKIFTTDRFQREAFGIKIIMPTKLSGHHYQKD